jgi:hypothetical protein
MADRITWTLAADASQVRAEMDRSVAAVNKGTKEMAGAFNQTDGSHRTMVRGQDRLLESNNRVTNQFGGFTRSLLSARSAADVLSSGLDRLENSTQSGLGTGIFLAVAAGAVQQIHALHEEYKKLNDEVKKLLGENTAGFFRSSAAIEGHLNKVGESLARLRKESGGGMMQSLKDAFGENLFVEKGQLLPDSGKAGRRRATDIAALQEKESALTEDALEKRRQKTGLKADALAGAPDYEIKARQLQMAHDEANHAVHAMTQAAIELNLAFKELAKTVTDKHLERSGMSLAEIAATPEFVQPGMTYEQLVAGQQARKAMELERHGEVARRGFQPELAHQFFNEAGAIKSGMTNLKPSEQMGTEFKGALRVTEDYLRAVAENTAKPLVNK